MPRLPTLCALLATLLLADPPTPVLVEAAFVQGSWLVPPRSVTFESLDTPILRARAWPFNLTSSSSPPRSWVMTSSCCGYGRFTEAAVSASSSAWGLFDQPCIPEWPILAEWGYEFMNDASNTFPVCGNLSLAAHGRPPTSRTEALSWLSTYWACRANDTRALANVTDDHTPTVSEIGHYLFAGLSSVFPLPGAGVVPGSEVGENINSIQLHLAATRGAARQGRQPFLIDFSSWMAGWITDYSPSPGFWGSSASSPVGGHSPSLVRRTYFSAFLAGAGALVAEAGAVNFFAENSTVPPFPLSPLGVIGAEIFAFSHALSSEDVRGIPYAPLALVTEAALGLGIGWFYRSMAWDSFPLSDGERTLSAYLDALWPGSYEVMNDFGTPLSESRYLVPSPYGDSIDLLLPGPSLTADLLSGGYRAALFVGSPEEGMGEALANEVAAYVMSGGCAIVHAADIVSAASAGWLPSTLLGLTLDGPPALVHASVVTDNQTGWRATAPVSHAPFCVADGANAYIKTGGNPSVTAGWDGGTIDKCCSTSPTTCKWFSSLVACDAALIMGASCRTCPSSASPQDVGCPPWPAPGSGPPGTLALSLTPATLLKSGQPLLSYTLADGSVALGATISYAGTGSLVVLLSSDPVASAAGSSGGFGLAAHLLSRIQNDTAPFIVASNVTTDGESGGGVQLLVNRTPWGWLATLINNNGIHKQPSEAAVIDAGAGCAVNLTLRDGSIASAWYSNGGGARVPLDVSAGGRVLQGIEVEAGGLRVVGVTLVQ